MNEPQRHLPESEQLPKPIGSEEVAWSDQVWERMASWVIASLDSKQLDDARQVLAEHPVLSVGKPAILRLALEEFTRRHEATGQVDVEAFVARFPEVADRLRENANAYLLLMGWCDSSLVRTPPPEHLWPMIPSDFGPFRLERLIGGGAESRVCCGIDLRTQQSLIIKITRTPGREVLVRNRLKSERIVPLLVPYKDVERQLVALPMPMLGTFTLQDLYRYAWSDHRLPRSLSKLTPMLQRLGERRATAVQGCYFELVVDVAVEVAIAINELHQAGLVHCDIKPANLLLGDDGLIRLLDFDLAHIEGTPIQRLGGTPQFMPSEQLERVTDAYSSQPGVAGVAHRSIDVFSFGAMLYLLCSGRFPFGWVQLEQHRDEAARLLLQQQRRGAVPLRTYDSALPTRFVRFVHRCLSFNPVERPVDMQAVIAELRRYQSPISRRVARVRRLFRDLRYDLNR